MTRESKSTVLNIALWIAQVLLAGMFIMAGAMKGFQPIDTVAESVPWASETPVGLVRFIGICELLGGLGLLLPALLRIRPELTGYAAIGLSIVMALALIFHLTRGEYPMVGINIVIGLVAAFVAWGRLKRLPIAPKT